MYTDPACLQQPELGEQSPAAGSHHRRRHAARTVDMALRKSSRLAGGMERMRLRLAPLLGSSYLDVGIEHTQSARHHCWASTAAGGMERGQLAQRRCWAHSIIFGRA
mmetsp:Transcript_22911/g.58448  ORF Transcript_22911/g.58448 Transcript_22911/m.58448 type:complete len:107 (-) Transcript_22911:1640-1960(-)